MPDRPSYKELQQKVQELEKAESDLKKIIQAAHENIGFYSELIDNVNDAVYIHKVTPDGEPGKFHQVNAAARTMLGYSDAEFKAMSPWELDDPNTSGSTIPKVMEELRTSGNARFEAVQLGKDGRKVVVEVNTVLTNLQGRRYIISVCRDITERKQVENALRISEKRFRNLVAELPKIAVQGYDRKRNVIYWNSASETLYGYSEEEAIGKKLEDLIIPATMKEGVIAAVHAWLEHDIAIPSSELVLRHKDGRDVPVYSSHVILVSSRGEKELYCVDLSLADLKLAENKSQQSEWFYRQLFDHSSSGVAVYQAIDNGEDFIFKDLNKAGEKIENLPREELLGRRVTEVFPGIIEFGLLEVFQQVWQTGEPAVHPLSLFQNVREKSWRENRIYKLPTGEVVAVYDDMTLQKQLEEEKRAIEVRLQRSQKMEAIGLMASGVAHDLNNILAGIVGYPELLLLRLPKESELRKPLEAIKDSGDRAVAVVSDLLTVARGVASVRTVVNINSIVKEYLDSPEYRHLRSQYPLIEVYQELGKELPHISCSTVHIKKCIMNLMINSCEAIGQSGRISLRTTSFHPGESLSIKTGLEQKTYVVLFMADTGSGILKENIDHIFEPFYTKKVMGRSGTGLGLSVVWNTMEDHNGKVFVESNEKGTLFKLYFPATESATVKETEIDERRNLSGGNEHILVVDDEPLLCDIASQMLQTSGYRVDVAGSGESAIRFLQMNPVDIIVLDMLMMPGINGYQTYQEILKMYPDQKAIIVSGFSESDDVKAALRIGAIGFIKKPYSMEQLLRAVKTALDG